MKAPSLTASMLDLASGALVRGLVSLGARVQGLRIGLARRQEPGAWNLCLERSSLALGEPCSSNATLRLGSSCSRFGLGGTLELQC